MFAVIADLPTLPRSIPCGPDSDVAYGEDGAIVRVTGPDFDSIDANVFHVEQQAVHDALSPETSDLVCAVVRPIFEWLWSDGTKNTDGLQNRAAICCWFFVPQLRALTMTQMAAGYGKKKQSFGRPVADWKQRFPGLRIAGMKD